MALELTHWEYSFLLHTCNVGLSTRSDRSPFSGEAIECPINHAVTDDEIDAIQDVFDEHGIDGPEPDGEGYAVYGADGSYLRFRCNELEYGEVLTGIAVSIVVKQLSDEILTVIFDVARAGNLALTSSFGDQVLVLNRAPGPKLLQRWPDARSLSTISELRHWLEGTIGGRQVHVPS